MPELEPIGTAASAQSRGSRPCSSRSRNSSNRPHLHHAVSGRHLDDHSLYHASDDVLAKEERESVDDESDYAEHVAEEDDEKVEEKDGTEETSEARQGIPNERDLEAPLEKKQTTKSAKDPNLVLLAFPGTLSE